MRTFVLCFGLAATLAVPAFGQKFEAGVFGGYEKSRASNLGTLFSSEGGMLSDTSLGNGHNYGVRATVNTQGYHGLELSYSRHQVPFRTQLSIGDAKAPAFEPHEERIRTTIFAGNWLFYFMPRDEKWRPYFTAGLHTQNYGKPVVGRLVPGDDGEEVFARYFSPRNTRYIGFNYGAGIKLRPAGPILFRLDFRHYSNGNPFQTDLSAADFTPIQDRLLPGRIGQMEFTVGVSYGFGF